MRLHPPYLFHKVVLFRQALDELLAIWYMTLAVQMFRIEQNNLERLLLLLLLLELTVIKSKRPSFGGNFELIMIIICPSFGRARHDVRWGSWRRGGSERKNKSNNNNNSNNGWNFRPRCCRWCCCGKSRQTLQPRDRIFMQGSSHYYFCIQVHYRELILMLDDKPTRWMSLWQTVSRSFLAAFSYFDGFNNNLAK